MLDAPSPPATGRVPHRDRALDAVRGLCIVSMTSAHLAPNTPPTRALHLLPWVDGASGFVLVSGLVLGMVLPGRVARGGGGAAARSLVRRARLLYLTHVAAVLLALASGLVVAHSHPLDGHALLATLTLQLNPVNVNILSLYVVLLLLAVPATALLRRGRLGWLGVASAALYVVGQVAPVVTTLPADGPLEFNWAAWQLLFLSALAVGWTWRTHGLQARVQSPRVVAVATGGLVVVVAAGLAATLLDRAEPVAGWVFDKGDAGPGRVLLAWLAFVVLYRCTALATARLPRPLLAPLEVVGRRSLDSFVILTVGTLLVAAVLPVDRSRVVSVAIAVAALVAMGVWAWSRDRWTAARRDPRPRV